MKVRVPFLKTRFTEDILRERDGRYKIGLPCGSWDS